VVAATANCGTAAVPPTARNTVAMGDQDLVIGAAFRRSKFAMGDDGEEYLRM